MRRSKSRRFQAKVVIWCMLGCTAIVLFSAYTEYVERRTVKRMEAQVIKQFNIEVAKSLQDRQDKFQAQFFNYSGELR